MENFGPSVVLFLSLGVLGGLVTSDIIFHNHKNAVYLINGTAVTILGDFNHGIAASPYSDLEYDLCGQRLCVLHFSGIYCTDPFAASASIVNIENSLTLPAFIADPIKGIEFCNGILYFHTGNEIFKANSFTIQKGNWTSTEVIQAMKVACDYGYVFFVTVDALYVTDLSLNNEPERASIFSQSMTNVRLGLWAQNESLLMLSNSVAISTFPLTFDSNSLPIDLIGVGTLVSPYLMAGISGHEGDIILAGFFGNVYKYVHPDSVDLIHTVSLIDNVLSDQSVFFSCDSTNNYCETTCGDSCGCCNGICTGYPADPICTCDEMEVCRSTTSDSIYGDTDMCALRVGFTYDDFPTINPDCITCPAPAMVSNGVYSFSSSPYYIGVIATLMCNTGYNANPDPCALTCDICGEFTNITCICEIVDCGMLTSPDESEANIGYSNTTYNAIVNVNCTTGIQSGGSTRTCLADGFWSGVEITCENISCGALTEPANGFYIYDSMAETATLMCESGFEIHNTTVRQCNDFIWDGTDRDCIDITSTPQPSTPEPPTTSQEPTTGMPSSSTDRPTEPPTTEEPLCPIISFPANGMIDYSLNRTVGSSATYVCDDGFEISSGIIMVRNCTGDSIWDGEDVNCTLITCDERNITNGNFAINPADRAVGSVATSTCDERYEIIKGDVVRNCTGNGAWDGEDIVCSLICPLLTITNGMAVYDPTNRAVNSIATSSCDTNYEIDSGSMTRTCQADGTWSGIPIVCTKITCEKLNISNGAVEYNPADRSVDSIATSSCDSGYEAASGDVQRTCQLDTNWTGSDLNCININECETLMPCLNGARCTDLPGSYDCVCLENYTGEKCDIYIPDNFICAVRRPYQNIRGKNAKSILIYSLHYGNHKHISRIKPNGKPYDPQPSTIPNPGVNPLLLPVSVGKDRFGPFECAANIIGEDRSIVAITRTKHGVYGSVATVTLCLGGTVDLTPIFTTVASGQLRWKFKGSKIDNTNGNMYYRISNAEAADEGLYETFVTQRYTYAHAHFQVYVDDCTCNSTCTANEGVCSATGTCLCPPGKYGDNCEMSCASGTFGTSCQWSCRTEFGGPFYDCKQILFCYEKPRGCLCYNGFTEPKCN